MKSLTMERAWLLQVFRYLLPENLRRVGAHIAADRKGPLAQSGHRFLRPPSVEALRIGTVVHADGRPRRVQPRRRAAAQTLTTTRYECCLAGKVDGEHFLISSKRSDRSFKFVAEAAKG